MTPGYSSFMLADNGRRSFLSHTIVGYGIPAEARQLSRVDSPTLRICGSVGCNSKSGASRAIRKN
jgi:hypothetical protein